MNEHEAERIAAAIHHLRPDWPVSSLRTLITTKLAERPRRDVAVALAWVACEQNTATPARVLEAGPWWRAAGIEGTARPREPYDAVHFCGVCGKPNHPNVDHMFIPAAHIRAAQDSSDHANRARDLIRANTTQEQQ